MPIYDYQCSSCGFKAEVMRKISAANIDACPECGAETFSKQLSAPSFQLSGSGWYATDFKNGSSSASTKPASNTVATNTESSAPEKKSEVTATPAACSTGCACH
jgi:putative FmdB family regulatory protein